MFGHSVDDNTDYRQLSAHDKQQQKCVGTKDFDGAADRTDHTYNSTGSAAIQMISSACTGRVLSSVHAKGLSLSREVIYRGLMMNRPRH